MYLVCRDDYGKLLRDNITKSYKTCSDNVKHSIDQEASIIATKLGIANRMEVCARKRAYITLKDHKNDFLSKPSCRLINPAKSEVGLVSKQILEKINTAIRTATGLRQWRNTASVIDWFKNLPSKQGLSFIKFDIVEFYPSITEKLLRRAISFAKLHTTISPQDLEIILHSRKSLLFDNASTWIKKEGSKFDVTMGSYDGAEVCELIGLFILQQLSSVIPKDSVGLYRDDGLSALKLTGPQADKLRKDIIAIFKDCDLRVTVETRLTCTDFLDVNMDLTN